MGKEDFIRKSTEKHGNNYDFSEFVYVNSITKGWITHNECGTRFERNPSCHLASKGCPTCSRKNASDVMRKTNDEFIKKAREIHGDKFDYSKVEYKGQMIKVKIIHIKCGNIFEQSPKVHLKGSSCNICSGHKTRTTEKFIEDAKKVHGDKFDYSEVIYVDTRTKVIIIHKMCRKRNEQTPKNHLKGRGCFYCSGAMAHTKEIFIYEAKKIHGDNYDYSKVDYKNREKNVIIIHKECGQENLQSPSNHLQGKKCNRCYGNTKKTNEEFIQDAERVHGDEYDYSQVEYLNSKEKVIISHKRCGRVFIQNPQKHLVGHRCNLCYSAKKLTNDTFISKAIKLHGDDYDYSMVDYVDAKTKIEILHKQCGTMFEQTPNSHLMGSGCIECYGTKKKTTEQFIEQAKKVHGNDYDYSNAEYVNNKTKVAIKHVKCGQTCHQAPISHLKGFGCNKCDVSKGELFIRNYLKQRNIPFIVEHKYPDCVYKRPLAFDFYLPEANLCIEFDGIQHFEPIGIFGGIKQFILQQKKDMIKNMYCLDKKINLCRIPYNIGIEAKMEWLVGCYYRIKDG